MKLNALPTALAAVLSTGAIASAQTPQATGQATKPNIVLVHGAYADGSSWGRVIPLLQAKGYHVVSVQNPTTSLADDVEATERVLNQQKGPVVLVGHSWAGVVITQAGNNPRVKALVYVDASAPDNGQSISDAAAALPSAPGASAGVKDQYDFLTLPEAAVRQYFAQDLSSADQGLIAAVQIPWYFGCLTDKVTHAAWHEKPSWWVYGENDHMINPKLQAQMAATMKARVTKLQTSHLAMLADPKAVTAVIVEAAMQVQAGKASRADSVPEGTIEAAAYTPVPEAPAVPAVLQSPAESAVMPAAQTISGPFGIIPVTGESAARITIDQPLADSLSKGRVVIPYRAQNVRIEPVYGEPALAVSPRIGHIHITVDDAPWHWLDASGEPLVITGMTAGPHKVLIELVNAVHQTLDYGVVRFEVPYRSLTPNNPKADGFRASPVPTTPVTP